MGVESKYLMASLIGLLVAATPVSAQEAADPHAAQPERPTVATHAGTVAPGWWEIETGIEADRYADRTHGTSVPSLIKIGLAPRLQLGVGLPAVTPPGSTLGIGDVTAGLKWRIADGAPIVSDFAILPAVKVPSGKEAAGRGTGTFDCSLLAISSRTVGPVSVDLNIGYTRRTGNGARAPKDATLWTASTGFPLWRTLGIAAELYGYPGTAGPAGARGIAALLCGPTVMVRRWLEVDAGVIVPLTGPQPKAGYAGWVWNVGEVWGGAGRSRSSGAADGEHGRWPLQCRASRGSRRR
jgi:hypothetical protein